ncbi:MAG: hypothetical protein KME42_10295 [Tildeniella nuda ZEHNDER 1965/U140]|nr:hypothetical protein [Tildeniella nuda ZEHNDER 1965/U140]
MDVSVAVRQPLANDNTGDRLLGSGVNGWFLNSDTDTIGDGRCALESDRPSLTAPPDRALKAQRETGFLNAT